MVQLDYKLITKAMNITALFSQPFKHWKSMAQLQTHENMAAHLNGSMNQEKQHLWRSLEELQRSKGGWYAHGTMRFSLPKSDLNEWQEENCCAISLAVSHKTSKWHNMWQKLLLSFFVTVVGLLWQIVEAASCSGETFLVRVDCKMNGAKNL